MEKKKEFEIIKIDEETYNKFYLICQKYAHKIPKGLEFYIEKIKKGENIPLYMKQFGLKEEQLYKYVEVYEIIFLFNQLKRTIDFFETEVTESELLEYQDVIHETNDEIEQLQIWLDEFEIEELNNTDENSEQINFIIFGPNIDMYMYKTSSSKSGRDKIALKNIASLLKQMKYASYFELRKKGNIHQMQNQINKQQAYIADLAYERMGRGATKVTYLRVPVSSNNKAILKEYYKNPLETLYLVLSYGDFKNESISEANLYRQHFFDVKKNEDFIQYMIDIFKNDFTEETLKIAHKIIEFSMSIDESINNSLEDVKKIY